MGEIKKDPTVALAKIKEIEEREKQFGPTERTTKRKEDLQVSNCLAFGSSGDFLFKLTTPLCVRASRCCTLAC